MSKFSGRKNISPYYEGMISLQLRKTLKKTFYAAWYGNYKETLVALDFYQMMLMGGEL